jgi:mannitol-1-/sugar-/sorbitol-6-/2-deoxyglucose-6-phosphatase
MPQVRAAIFDMDGLLIDSEPLWRVAERDVYERAGLHVTEELLKRTEGLRLAESVQLVLDEVGGQQLSRNDLELEITLSMEELLTAQGAPMPGVHETLETLRRCGIPTALASSSSRPLVAAVIRKLGLQGCFTAVCSGDQEAFGKPHPQIFLSAARGLQVDPVNCMVFEDSLNGVLAAKAARMFCVAVPSPYSFDDPRLAIADVKLRSLLQFELSMIALE